MTSKERIEILVRANELALELEMLVADLREDRDREGLEALHKALSEWLTK